MQAAGPVRNGAVAKWADRIAVRHDDSKFALKTEQRKRVMMAQTVVIGAGPAGLMAAEQLADAGHSVLVAEAKPSVARKFLMAGKSGLNLTKDEPFEQLIQSYDQAHNWLGPIIAEFDAHSVQGWAQGLGQELFTGSTGRVFPKVMKASPLLRAWLARLGEKGVQIRTRWRWTGWEGSSLVFETSDDRTEVQADATILALGGASWSRLGSDGAWVPVLADKSVPIAPFAPANSALSVEWSAYMQAHLGAALKAVRWTAGELESRGEATISANGLEGGGLYPLTPALRDGVLLCVDLLPDLTRDELKVRFARKKTKTTLSQWLKNGLRLSPQKIALFHEMSKGDPQMQEDPVRLLKKLPIRHAGLRPLDEAISTAGGVKRSAMDDGLMLRDLPGVFCAGEMLDWEAPTGGYLLTACLATGRWAGRSAAEWLQQTVNA